MNCHMEMHGCVFYRYAKPGVGLMLAHAPPSSGQHWYHYTVDYCIGKDT